MGPLALMDLIGLDTAYEILDTMYKQGRDRLHAPSPILKQMVTAGLKGRKTGRGFYTYDGAGLAEVVDDAADAAPPTGRPRVLRAGRRRSASSARARWPTGIVEVFAKGGYDVTFVARCRRAGRGRRERAIAKSLEKAVQRGKLAEADRDAALARLTGTHPPGRPGRRRPGRRGRRRGRSPVKQALFENLDEICQARRHPGHDDVLPAGHRVRRGDDRARATSSGMHFFNPAPVMRLVEVVRTVVDRRDVVGDRPRSVRAASASTPSPAVTGPGSSSTPCCSRTSTTRCGCSRRTTPAAEDIDTAMKTGCGYPMGPFELLDAVGLDVSLAIQRELYLEFREPGFAPAPLLEQLVTAGYLGRKTGRGFRDLRLRGGETSAPSPSGRRGPMADTGAMPSRRRPSKHAREHVPLDVTRIQGGTTREEAYAGVRWTVRSVTGATATRDYLCPGLPAGHHPGDTPRRRLAGRGGRRPRGPAALARRLLAAP